MRVDKLLGGGGRAGGGAGRGGGSSSADGRREMRVADARALVEEAEAERLISPEAVAREAVASAEADGIVFIDEIDKIVVNHETRYGGSGGADASSEGVQVRGGEREKRGREERRESESEGSKRERKTTTAAKVFLEERTRAAELQRNKFTPHPKKTQTKTLFQRDLLPIIEGSVVATKHGNVNTDHMLFICSGAFSACKPSDMLAELQGRLPIRVELKALTGEVLKMRRETEGKSSIFFALLFFVFPLSPLSHSLSLLSSPFQKKKLSSSKKTKQRRTSTAS
jgi:ATP-dependent protease HslVU (ClpYQ) ATPase subunit